MTGVLRRENVVTLLNCITQIGGRARLVGLRVFQHHLEDTRGGVFSPGMTFTASPQTCRCFLNVWINGAMTWHRLATRWRFLCKYIFQLFLYFHPFTLQ